MGCWLSRHAHELAQQACSKQAHGLLAQQACSWAGAAGRLIGWRSRQAHALAQQAGLWSGAAGMLVDWRSRQADRLAQQAGLSAGAAGRLMVRRSVCHAQQSCSCINGGARLPVDAAVHRSIQRSSALASSSSRTHQALFGDACASVWACHCSFAWQGMAAADAGVPCWLLAAASIINACVAA